jgi:hypothetical protein
MIVVKEKRMSVLDCPIPKEAWVLALGGRNGSVTRLADQEAAEAGSWNASVQRIVELDQLGEDWDGLGAIPPSPELIESAVRLACLLSAQGVEPPQTVAAGTDGSINFGWQDVEGQYAEVEIVRPFFAEVMVIEPGKPAKHWTLPTE